MAGGHAAFRGGDSKMKLDEGWVCCHMTLKLICGIHRDDDIKSEEKGETFQPSFFLQQRAIKLMLNSNKGSSCTRCLMVFQFRHFKGVGWWSVWMCEKPGCYWKLPCRCSSFIYNSVNEPRLNISIIHAVWVWADVDFHDRLTGFFGDPEAERCRCFFRGMVPCKCSRCSF